MLSVDLTIGDDGGHAVATALSEAADRGNVVIAGLAGLALIDASGVAALVRARRHAHHMGDDFVLACSRPHDLGAGSPAVSLKTEMAGRPGSQARPWMQ
jgi:hypothetical protein